MSDDPGTPVPAPPPRSAVRATRSVIWIVAALVVAAGGVAGFVTTRGGSSGAFSSGDCVVLTSSSVRPADCGSHHDGEVTGVLHQTYQACPGGSEEFDVTDNTGNLCVDRSR